MIGLAAGRAAGWTSVLSFGVAALVGSTIALIVGVYHLHAFDFWSVWTGPRALILGMDPYEVGAYGQILGTITTVGHSPFSPVYAYPPATAVALLPLGLLDFDAALLVWTFGGIAAATIAIAAVLRAYAPGDALLGAMSGVALTLSAPAITTLFNAQWGFIQLAALALAVLAVRSDLVVGGLGVFVLLLKPQAFVLAIPSLMLWALASGADRAFRGFAAAIAIVIVLTLAQPAALYSWFQWIPSYVADGARVNPNATLTGVLVSVFLTHPAITAAIVLAAGAAAILVMRRHASLWFPASVPISLAAAPHGRSYDQLVLLVVLVVAAAGVERLPRLLTVAALASFIVGSFLLYAIALVRHDEFWSTALPVLLGLLLGISALVREHPRSRPSPG